MSKATQYSFLDKSIKSECEWFQFDEDTHKLDENSLVEDSKTNYNCESCNKSFATKKSRYVHFRVHHSDEKSHICSSCNKFT